MGWHWTMEAIEWRLSDNIRRDEISKCKILPQREGKTARERKAFVGDRTLGLG